nr:MAG TPA: hypothetical protein [Caudoviricetes sp.]
MSAQCYEIMGNTIICGYTQGQTIAFHLSPALPKG